jgi:hypothetical protein
MRAIFRFCIFPVIFLGTLLIAAEYLLFDNNPNVKNLNVDHDKYRKDSLVLENVTAYNQFESKYNFAFNESNNLAQTLILESHFKTYDSAIQIKQSSLNFDSRSFKSGSIIKGIYPENKKVYYNKKKAIIKNKNNKRIVDKESFTEVYINNNIRQNFIFRSDYGNSDTSDKMHIPVNTNPLMAAAGRVYTVWPCLFAGSADKRMTPLSKEIFDTMLNTVKNKVKSAVPFSVYPNPATDKLTIALQDWESVESIQLFTIYGKLVYKSELPQNEINVTKFTSGMYVLIITNKDGAQNSQKIMINRK